MATTAPFDVDGICTRALRKIGAYPIRSSGVRPPEMEEAREWLDIMVRHLCGTRRRWWHVAETQSFPLYASTRDYDLAQALGGNAPNGVQFVIAAWLCDADGLEIAELPLLRRLEYDRLLLAEGDSTGQPTACHVDRKMNPTLRLVEAPAEDDTYTVKVLFQDYVPSLRGASPSPAALASFRAGYELYLITALSALLADGPIRKLPADEIKDLRDQARVMLAELEVYEDQEQNNKPRQVAFYNGI